MMTGSVVLATCLLVFVVLLGIPIVRDVRAVVRWQLIRRKQRKLQREWEARRRARMVEALR